MCAGSMAGMFQTSVTYPLDMIRTRLSMASLSHVHYNGIFDCGAKILKQEGVMAMYVAMHRANLRTNLLLLLLQAPAWHCTHGDGVMCLAAWKTH